MDTRQGPGNWETTGVITTVAKHRSVISVRINDIMEALPFSKCQLLTYGYRCEGHMTNILEEGMEVNVMYSISQSQDKPSVIFVFIGELPDFSDLIDPVGALEEVYDQTGLVDEILNGSFTVRGDAMTLPVVVKNELVYRDGCLLADTHVTEGERVTFDAVPIGSGHDPSTASYQATCAWLGRAPRLVDRFGLSVKKPTAQNLDVLTADRVYGTVVTIPNDYTAFVKVEDIDEKVMVFRSSFDHSCERVQDVIEVGDALCMRLSYSYIFQGCRQWFAEKASKDGVFEKHDREMQATQLDEVNPPEFLIPDEKTSAVTKDKEGVVEVHPPEFLIADKKKSAITKKKDKEGVIVFKKNSRALYSDRPLKGVFHFVSKGKTKSLIQYSGLGIFAKLPSLFVGDGSKEDKIRLLSGQKKPVKFEAVLRYPEGKKYKKKVKVTHEATCVWTGKKPLLSAFLKAKSIPVSRCLTCFCLTPVNDTFCAKVENFYLPDIALVEVQPGNHKACLHIRSFDSDSQWYQSRKMITDFVQWDDLLSFNVTETHECGVFLPAVNIKVWKNCSEETRSNVMDFIMSKKPKEESSEETSSSECDVAGRLPFDEPSAAGIPSDYSSSEDSETMPPKGGAGVSEDCTARAHSKQINPLFTKTSTLLWNDPPLTGFFHLLTVDKLLIKYSGINVLFIPGNFYINGRLGDFRDFELFCKSKTAVNFEASKIDNLELKKCGISHRAHLVWFGEKPSLLRLANDVGSIDTEILSIPEQTFVGIVARFFFPDVAILKVRREGAINPSVVCLHLSSFTTKPQRSLINGKGFISDHVKHYDKVQFKVKANELCPLGLCAYDPRKITKEEYTEAVKENK